MPAAAPPTSLISDVDAARVDAAIDQLQVGARTWTHLTLTQRRVLLERIRSATAAVSDEWVDAASNSKGLEPGHPLRGEEWLGGPYAVLGALDASIHTLRVLENGGSPLDGVPIDDAPGGRIRINAFPSSKIDGLLLSGYTGEVWLEPGVTVSDAVRSAGLGQRTPGESGGIGLVLGAGNVSSIPYLDVLYELLAYNRVSILKVNPTQDALVPVFERALAPLITPGFLQIVTGGGDVGGYLTQHPSINHVHITGSAVTFDAIVWGTGAKAEKRRSDNTPLLGVPITAELGGVSPIIVVPGEWTAADLKFQAEHVATMRLQNSGHNCIAGQVVILSSDWPQREAFMAALRTAYASAPGRPVWYPRSDDRLKLAATDYPETSWFAGGTRALVEIGAGDDPKALETTEYFAPVLGVVELPGTGKTFLDAAVTHANNNLTGTLGANIIVDPGAETALGAGLEAAVAALRYGTVAVNTWTALGFAAPTLSWGAFPGGTLADAPSGIGVVHNALLLDHIERSVVRGPFRPFPRSLTGGRFSALPKPPWFVSARTAAAVSEGLAAYRADGRISRLPLVLLKAFGA